MKVRDEQGQTWRVTRRWVPWRRRLKGALGSVPDLPVGLGSDPISAIVGIVCLIVLIPFLLLAAVAGVELLLLLLVFPFAVLARVVFGQHWTIEARRGFRIWWQDSAGDWQASGIRIHEVAAAIERGVLPPQNVDAPHPGQPKQPGEPGQSEA